MSQHTVKTVLPVVVQMGYDRPLNYVYCIVSTSDDMLYSNLADPDAGTECQDVEYFRGKLAELGITVPESMYAETRQDQIDRVGNRAMEHTPSGKQHDMLREVAGRLADLHRHDAEATAALKAVLEARDAGMNDRDRRRYLGWSLHSIITDLFKRIRAWECH